MNPDAAPNPGPPELTGPPALPADPFANDPSPFAGEGTLPDEVIRPLVRTKGWLVFFAVVFWIAVALLGTGAVMMLFFISYAGAFGSGLGWERAFFWAWGGMVMLMAVFFLLGALRMSKCASRISLLMYTRRVEDLASVLEQKRAFWKTAGIAFITVVASYIFMYAGLMYFAFTSSFRYSSSSSGVHSSSGTISIGPSPPAPAATPAPAPAPGTSPSSSPGSPAPAPAPAPSAPASGPESSPPPASGTP